MPHGSPWENRHFPISTSDVLDNVRLLKCFIRTFVPGETDCLHYFFLVVAKLHYIAVKFSILFILLTPIPSNKIILLLF